MLTDGYNHRQRARPLGSAPGPADSRMAILAQAGQPRKVQPATEALGIAGLPTRDWNP